MPLQDQTVAYLLELARLEPDREICGLVLQNGAVHPILNVARHPERTFEMDPMQQLQAIQSFGKDIVGVYHSHPSGTDYPSLTDYRGWPRNGWRYWIVSSDHVSEWELFDEGEFVDLTACVRHQYPKPPRKLA